MRNFTILVTLLVLAVPNINLHGQGLPSSWANKDIGVTPNAGSATYDEASQTFTIKGSGLNFWDTDDAHLAYVKITGDFTFKVRVLTFTSSAMGGSAKTGINARNSLDSNAPSIMEAWENWGGLATTARMGPGVTPTWTGGTLPGADAIPWYLRMTRTGDVFTTYESVDDVVWTQTDTRSMDAMLATIYVGLAVSPNNGEIATATFDKVHITGEIVAGIDEITFPAAALAVYPNPVNDRLNIASTGSNIIHSVTITDLTGKSVRQIAVNSSKESIDVTELSPGLYFLKAATDKGVVNRRFIRK